jgi:UDP-N-acetylglucosamine 2-epimerase (non-hydrolysing)
MTRILHVVGARPNFVKAAPVIRALGRRPVEQTVVHTGQHYDSRLSAVFFEELGIPAPDVNLAVGSGSHARQTADIMVGLEALVQSRPFDVVTVYGDVNSTAAAAMVAAKAGVALAHVEAGLRSGDRTMPEEINRLVTDRLSDLLFTPSEDANEHLRREGVDAEKIHFVGNVMIDSLVRMLPKIDFESSIRKAGLSAGDPYVLVTLHRPSNVDDADHLAALLQVLAAIAARLPVIFPVHPRTRSMLGTFEPPRGLLLSEPFGYLDFLALMKGAALVVTDSGGIQEETTWLGIPCLTVRDNTERPITVALGTNRLIGRSPARLRLEMDRVLAGDRPRGGVPPLWDGRAADRISEVLDRQPATTAR